MFLRDRVVVERRPRIWMIGRQRYGQDLLPLLFVLAGGQLLWGCVCDKIWK